MQGIIHPWRPMGGLSDREKWRQEKARESVLENFGHRFSDSTDRPWVFEGGASLFIGHLALQNLLKSIR